MRYERAMILTDLDGTLFNSRGEVSADDRAAIDAFIRGGGLFGLATGREPHNALRFLPGLPINAPSIVLNGAAVYDFVAQRYLFTQLLDRDAALSALAFCLDAALPLDLQVYTTDGIYYASPLEQADPGFLRIHQPAAYLPPALVREKSLFKLVLLERVPGALAPLGEFLSQSGLDRMIGIVEGTTDVVKVGKYRELLPRGVSKATGVAAIRALPVFAGRTLFAVGDYWNDYELLRASDVACAPANAIDEIKAICAHILPSHNDGAVAHLIRDVIPSL